jgi:cytochrome c oxidase subunit 2
MIEDLIPAGSTYARDIDNVILLIGALAGFWFVVTMGMFGWLLWRFREREGVKTQYVTGDEPHLVRWVSWPHILILICDIAIVAAAVLVWVNVKQTLPADSTVRVIIAQQWAWTFVHAGPDGQLDTADDVRTVDELNLQVDRLYHYELHSKDVLHSFSVPVFRLKQDAVPGRAIRGWFKPTVTGEFDIQCAEICGIGHGLMPARVRIRSAAEQTAWLSQAVPAAQLASAAASPAATATAVAAVAAHVTHDHAQGHPGGTE